MLTENPRSCPYSTSLTLGKVPELPKTGDVAQLVQCMPGMQETLSSTPGMHKPGMVLYTCNLSTQEGE